MVAVVCFDVGGDYVVMMFVYFGGDDDFLFVYLYRGYY